MGNFINSKSICRIWIVLTIKKSVGIMRILNNDSSVNPELHIHIHCLQQLFTASLQQVQQYLNTSLWCGLKLLPKWSKLAEFQLWLNVKNTVVVPENSAVERCSKQYWSYFMLPWYWCFLFSLSLYSLLFLLHN